MAQALHWSIALLVFMQVGIGLYVDDLPVSLARLQWLSRHKSLGLLIFALVVFRLVWRKFNPAPPLPATMSAMERRLAMFSHSLLYFLLLTAPVAGWLHASAAGLGASFFGWFSLPSAIGRDAALAEIFHGVHSVLVKSLAVLVTLHIAAALRHALLLRDGIMGRMLPFGSKRS